MGDRNPDNKEEAEKKFNEHLFPLIPTTQIKKMKITNFIEFSFVTGQCKSFWG